jgi:hypothetical protein
LAFFSAGGAAAAVSAEAALQVWPDQSVQEIEESHQDAIAELPRLSCL